jgi:hypothetical protein
MSVMTIVVATGHSTFTRNQGWWGTWQATCAQNVANSTVSHTAGAADAAVNATCMHAGQHNADISLSCLLSFVPISKHHDTAGLYAVLAVTFAFQKGFQNAVQLDRSSTA